MRRRINAADVCALVLACSPTLYGQLPPLPGELLQTSSNSTPSAATESSTEEQKARAIRRRGEVAEQIRVAQKTLNGKKNSEADAPADETSPEVELLKQLEAVHAQQEAAASREEELVAEKAELESQLESLRRSGPEEDAPYSFSLLERLRDQLVLAVGRNSALEIAVDGRKKSLERARTTYEEQERARRRAKEKVETNTDPQADSTLKQTLALEELESQLAEETVKLRQAELRNEELTLATHKLQNSFYKEKIALVSQDVVVTAEDRSKAFESLAKLESRLSQRRADAESNAAYHERQWLAFRKQLDDQTEASPVLAERTEASRLAHQAERQRLAVINQRLGRLSTMREVWERRFDLLEDTAEPKARSNWRGEVEEQLRNLDLEAKTQQATLAGLRREMTALEARIDAVKQETPEAARWVEAQLQHLRESVEVAEQNLGSIEDSRSLHAKLLAQIVGDEQAVTASQRFEDTKKWIQDAWNQEIVSVDDRPVTPRKIVIGLLLVVVGFLVAKVLSGILGRRFLRRLGMHPSGVAAIQSLTFYFLIVMFTLLALRVINIPLTVFTLLGGAVALGVGFGSQNIVNNFMSGLILLAERPIRIGDLIEIDNCFATVDRIGTRSTRITTGQNLEIIVPNSKFLENNVTNWTLSNDRIRTCVNVGVTYGSPVEEVRDLLTQAAKEQPGVLPSPEPIVLFRDFGDNSLNFEIHFWLRARTLFERLKLESALRYEICRLFREAKIVIAFPQRDVHLDTLSPLEVRMLPNEANGNPPAGMVKSSA